MAHSPAPSDAKSLPSIVAQSISKAAQNAALAATTVLCSSSKSTGALEDSTSAKARFKPRSVVSGGGVDMIVLPRRAVLGRRIKHHAAGAAYAYRCRPGTLDSMPQRTKRSISEAVLAKRFRQPPL